MTSWCFFLCQLHLLAGRGCFPEAELLRPIEQSVSDSVCLLVAEAENLGWELTAGGLSSPVEREPVQVPVHHLQSAGLSGQLINITVKATPYWGYDDKRQVQYL